MKKLVGYFLIAMTLCLGFSSLGLAADKTAAFIRQTAFASPESDDMIVQQLQGLGFKVTQFDHEKLADLNPANFSLVVITSTVNSGYVASGCPALFTAATPIINWEPGLGDELKIAAKTLNANNATDIEIKAQHPVTAGITGKVAIATTPQVIMGGGGNLGKGVQVLATSGTANVLMAVEKGATLLDDVVSPARRVFFAGSDIFLATGTDAAKTLFKQAVTWATGK